jgi:rare lipoprotein A
MDALQANHDERPANPCGRAHPFSSVHPYGLPCESRAEAPGPSCLQSIAWNGSDNGRGICGSVCLADRRLAALAHYSPKTVLKLIFLSASIALSAFAPAAVEAASSCGYASHYGYGDGFAWRTMANGRPMDPNAMTTAHPSLPLGTRILVTNPANGKSVNLVISDRGPYHGGRILDLSSGAFSRIASLGQGIAKVCFSRV